jgi:hypothetical protein
MRGYVHLASSKDALDTRINENIIALYPVDKMAQKPYLESASCHYWEKSARNIQAMISYLPPQCPWDYYSNWEQYPYLGAPPIMVGPLFEAQQPGMGIISGGKPIW